MENKIIETIMETLQGQGLRPTRQRRILVKKLYANGDRHVTADSLFQELRDSGSGVSRATVYNTLNILKESGLLREVVVDSAHSYFDTNTTAHHHFFYTKERRLEDIPGDRLVISRLPEPPKGSSIRQVNVIVRLDS